MPKALTRLLEQPEDAITKLIDQLEQKNGYPSHDVRAVAENLQKIRLKIGELNLDPDDTTPAELYHALLVKFEKDARRFDEHFGCRGQGYDAKIQKAIELVSKNASLPERWVLKSTAAKQLLRQHPPKQTMKLLNYRSVDSLVKRENLAELYLGVEVVESASWNKHHFQLASRLETTAFESRRLQLQSLTSRWGLRQTDENYVGSSNYGVLGLLPNVQIRQMSLLALVALLLDEVEVEPSEAAKLSPTAAWWSETDGLIADLTDTTVSLNLKDICLNHSNQAEADEHHRATAQRHFWKELLSRYENQPLIEEDDFPKLELPPVNFGPYINQPVFEYVEDM